MLQLKGAIPDTLSRGKRSLAVDLKHTEGVGVVRKVCQHADVIIEPFRPGRISALSNFFCRLGCDSSLYAN